MKKDTNNDNTIFILMFSTIRVDKYCKSRKVNGNPTMVPVKYISEENK